MYRVQKAINRVLTREVIVEPRGVNWSLVSSGQTADTSATQTAVTVLWTIKQVTR